MGRETVLGTACWRVPPGVQCLASLALRETGMFEECSLAPLARLTKSKTSRWHRLNTATRTSSTTCQP